ncbi:hypothetical protein [Paraburkholderia phenazinium]|jgi:hypothetical protein|uniref:hypothetical protein n=1 Tax=Paraburkholderia phenazinium TaxID=60549 RepID=UPI00115FFB17|nr:hypothetical protein [Paraburkholderia phenazinium]
MYNGNCLTNINAHDPNKLYGAVPLRQQAHATEAITYSKLVFSCLSIIKNNAPPRPMMQLHNTRSASGASRQATRFDVIDRLHAVVRWFRSGIGKKSMPDLHLLLRSVRKAIYRLAERW